MIFIKNADRRAVVGMLGDGGRGGGEQAAVGQQEGSEQGSVRGRVEPTEEEALRHRGGTEEQRERRLQAADR